MSSLSLFPALSTNVLSGRGGCAVRGGTGRGELSARLEAHPPANAYSSAVTP
jgi:hypothetical protein